MDRRLILTPRMRGFTMTEMGIVLFIFALVMSGVWTVARNMNENSKQAEFTELLQTISNNVRGYASGRASIPTTGTTETMATLATIGALPSQVSIQVSSTWVVDAPFGRSTNPHYSSSPHRSLYICGWKVDGTPSSRCVFSEEGAGVATADVPLFAIEGLMNRRYCINAVVRNSNVASLPGLVAIYVNGSRQTLPVSVTAAQTACSNANVNYADWVFRPNT